MGSRPKDRGAHASHAGTLERNAFLDRVNAELVPFDDGRYVMGYLRIKGLRHYNRTFGLEAGDAVLGSVAELLQELSVSGLVARYTGNAFAFVFPSSLAGTVSALLSSRVPDDAMRANTRIKLGTVVCRRPLGAQDCVERARFACGTIVDAAGVAERPFDADLQLTYEKHAYVVDHLDDAIANGEIRAYSQAIVRLITGRICEVEVLARWESERYGFLRPDEFIPDLERHRLIHRLDLEVFRLACAQWSMARELGTNVPFGINLSRLDFELCDIYGSVRALMERYGVPVDQVHIEVTESALAASPAAMNEGVDRFREAGFQVYMDDFGSGYSSLGAMADLRFDVIKIDKQLIDHVEDDERARVVLADTVGLVKRLGMQTLCEGVETEEQMLFLRAIGCEKAQGFFFSRPMPHEQIMERLRERAIVNESPGENDYLDAVGRISLLDGTSPDTNGVEAAPFHGKTPIAVLEFSDQGIRKLTGNLAYTKLMDRMGFSTLDAFVEYTSRGTGRVNARAMQAARRSKETGRAEQFDFIVGATFCSASLRFVAEVDGREAYLNIVTSVENSPQVTEHTLLTGLLEGGSIKYFWKDTQRRFLGANQAFLDYFGIQTLAEIIGSTDEDMGWNADVEPYRSDELDILEGASVKDVPGVISRRGELRKIITTKRPLHSRGAIVGLVGFFEDVGPVDEGAAPTPLS